MCSQENNLDFPGPEAPEGKKKIREDLITVLESKGLEK